MACCAILQEWGAAVACCDGALQVNNSEDVALKAWLRRAKANLGCHEFEVGRQVLHVRLCVSVW